MQTFAAILARQERLQEELTRCWGTISSLTQRLSVAESIREGDEGPTEAKTCGGGSKERTRAKTVQEMGTGVCTGQATEIESCNINACKKTKISAVLSISYIIIF